MKPTKTKANRIAVNLWIDSKVKKNAIAVLENRESLSELVEHLLQIEIARRVVSPEQCKIP